MAFYVPRWKAPSWVGFSGPFILLALTSYCTWGFAHRLCYDQLYRRQGHRSVAIGLICVVSFLDTLLIVLWCQVKIIGPGRLPKVPPFMILPDESVSDRCDKEDTTISSLLPPSCYLSGPNGHPIWCNDCESVKTDRAHHSSDLRCCVPRFDHRCIWLNAVIGRDNYRLFLQFVMYMAILTAIVLVTICVFLKQIRHDLDHNLIAILVIAIFGNMMTNSMLFTHILCIAKNRTSVEVLARKSGRGNVNYCCYYNSGDSCRYVVQLERDEYSNLWCKTSAWSNFTEFLGTNILFWFIPVGFPKHLNRHDLEENNNGIPSLQAVLGRYYETYSDESKEMIQKKIAHDQYLKKFYAFGDRYI